MDGSAVRTSQAQQANRQLVGARLIEQGREAAPLGNFPFKALRTASECPKTAVASNPSRTNHATPVSELRTRTNKPDKLALKHDIWCALPQALWRSKVLR
jgi:hypothetical protein